MTSWTEMTAIEFDATLAPNRAARKIAETASETLFPRLMPEPKHKTATEPEQLPGQESLFGD